MSPFGCWQWIWVLAVDEAGARRGGEAEARSADGDAAVGTDEDGGAQAPDAGPPRAARSGAQRGTVFFGGGLPGGERSPAQFAMALVGVAMGEEL